MTWLYTSPSKIIRVDPGTLAWEVAVSFQSSELSLGGSLEYAFGYLWAGGYDRKIAKIDLSDWSYETYSYSSVVSGSQFHALTSGGGYIWGSCPHYSEWQGWYADTIVRINPSNPADYTLVYISTLMCDDMTYTGGYLYTGSEKSPSYVYKISDSLTYSSAKASDTLCYAIFAHDSSIWGAYVGSPGKIVEFDSSLNIRATYQLPVGFNNANEITFDTAGNMYVTCWESPAKIVKLSLSEQPQLKAPWVGIAKITQGNNGTTSHYDHGTWDNTYAIDVALPLGSDVLAPADGVVKYVDNNSSGAGGKELALEHVGPTGKKFVTVYLHLDSILVSEGESVKQGQIVAKSGATGDVTGPHLHFHMWKSKGSEPEWAYDSHTMPIERLVMKQVGVDSDFREYDARKGELDDSKVAGKLFESNNIPLNKPPIADAGRDRSVSSGDFVQFDGSNSYDPDGSIVSYRWHFGDGTAAEGKIVNHRFRGAQNEPKIYTVTLAVQDNYGTIAINTIFVTVKPLKKLVDVGPGYFGVSCWMEATYNWVGTDEATGENLYIISKIETYSGGISGAYQLFILRRTSPPPSIPKLVWYIPLPTAPILRTYVTPFTPSLWQKLWGEPAEITTLTFQEGTFQGIGVTDTSLMLIVATGTETGITLYYDAGLTKFEPSSPIVRLKPEELKELWELRDIIDLLNKIVGIIGSPCELRIYDSDGHVTGLVNGEIKEEIPGSAYANGTILILSPNETYRYELVGIDEGTYKLLIISVEDVDATTFTATEIPTSSNAIHQYTIDWSALSRGEEGVNVQIDSNSDGTFEKTFTSDSELTGEEFMQHFPPSETSHMWIIGASVATIAIGTVTVAFIWRKRKRHPTKG